jgi:hypothetical protein
MLGFCLGSLVVSNIAIVYVLWCIHVRLEEIRIIQIQALNRLPDWVKGEEWPKGRSAKDMLYGD